MTHLLFGNSAVACVLFALASADAIDLPHWREPRSCGPSCSYLMLRLHGINASYEDVCSRIALTDEGASVLEIQRGCASFGLELLPVRATTKELGNVRLPAIAHQNRDTDSQHPGGHYVVVLKQTDKTLTVLDPTLARIKEMSRDAFIHSWSGVLLLRAPGRAFGFNGWALTLLFLSQITLIGWTCLRTGDRAPSELTSHVKLNPRLGCLMLVAGYAIAAFGGCSERTAQVDDRISTASRPEPSLRVSAPIACAGWVPIGQSGEARFQLSNRTTADCAIEYGRPSCACLDLEIIPASVPAQGTAEIVSRIGNTGTPGPFGARFSIRSDCEDWTRELVVEAYTAGVVFNSDMIVFTDRVDSVRKIAAYAYSEVSEAPLEFSLADDPAVSGMVLDSQEIEPPVRQGLAWVRKVTLAFRHGSTDAKAPHDTIEFILNSDCGSIQQQHRLHASFE